jgi:GntR family transcriptional regulator
MNEANVKVFLDKGKTSIPLYNRIESILRNKIVSGQYEPGDRLPNEDDFAGHYGVSKITIRNALARLESEGLIVRTPGKGTFVSEHVIEEVKTVFKGDIYNIVSDSQKYDVVPLGLETKKIREVRNARTVRTFLNKVNEDEISVVRRVRMIKEMPVFYLENIIPTEFGSQLTLEELSEGPLLKILKKKTGLSIGRGELYMEIVPSDVDVAQALNIQFFDSVVLLQVFYWHSSGEPFEVVNTFMRTDFFKYKVELDAQGFGKI